MRLLHTSDLHIGQSFFARSRHHEHLAYLNWLVDLAREREVDAVLIAGDVFDTGTPSSQARELYNGFCAEFMKGIYRVVRLGVRFNRVMGRGAYAVRGGIAVPVNETVDASVFSRYQTHPGYRPPSLETCLKGRNVDPLRQTDDLYL